MPWPSRRQRLPPAQASTLKFNVSWVTSHCEAVDGGHVSAGAVDGSVPKIAPGLPEDWHCYHSPEALEGMASLMLVIVWA